MNTDIKLLAAGRGLFLWQVAVELGVCAETFCRWLRKELSAERRAVILAAIERLSSEGGA